MAWTFEIRADERLIIVPDEGGQMDMLPRDPAQLAWAAENLEPLPGISWIWPTVFQAEDDDALERARQRIADALPDARLWER